MQVTTPQLTLKCQSSSVYLNQTVNCYALVAQSGNPVQLLVDYGDGTTQLVSPTTQIYYGNPVPMSLPSMTAANSANTPTVMANAEIFLPGGNLVSLEFYSMATTTFYLVAYLVTDGSCGLNAVPNCATNNTGTWGGSSSFSVSAGYNYKPYPSPLGPTSFFTAYVQNSYLVVDTDFVAPFDDITYSSRTPFYGDPGAKKRRAYFRVLVDYSTAGPSDSYRFSFSKAFTSIGLKNITATLDNANSAVFVPNVSDTFAITVIANPDIKLKCQSATISVGQMLNCYALVTYATTAAQLLVDYGDGSVELVNATDKIYYGNPVPKTLSNVTGADSTFRNVSFLSAEIFIPGGNLISLEVFMNIGGSLMKLMTANAGSLCGGMSASVDCATYITNGSPTGAIATSLSYNFSVSPGYTNESLNVPLNDADFIIVSSTLAVWAIDTTQIAPYADLGWPTTTQIYSDPIHVKRRAYLRLLVSYPPVAMTYRFSFTKTFSANAVGLRSVSASILGGSVSATFNVNVTKPLEMSVDISTSCTGGLNIAQACPVTFTIRALPYLNYNLRVKLFTSDDPVFPMLAQLCRPTVFYGANYNVSQTANLTMSSSAGTSQFDMGVFDIGPIVNSGISSTDADNTITVMYNIVVVDNQQINGDKIMLSVSVEDSVQNSANVEILELYFAGVTVSQTASATLTGTPSSATAQIGQFGTFQAVLSVYQMRYFTLTFTATASKSSLAACSIHVINATSCYDCLNVNKDYVSSQFDSDNNNVKLDLGYVANTCLYSATSTATAANSQIAVSVRYRVSATALASSSGAITLTARMTTPTLGSVTTSFVHTVAYAAASLSNNVLLPSVESTSLSADSNTTAAVYQSFTGSILLSIPTGYSDSINVAASPMGAGSQTGGPRAKICSVLLGAVGDNLPCERCMTDEAKAEKLNPGPGSEYDAFSWTGTLTNFGLRAASANGGTASQVRFDVVGQLLPHSANTAGINLTILVGVSSGLEQLELFTWPIQIISPPLSATGSTLDARVSLADTPSTVASPLMPRLLFFDLYTKPGDVYAPMSIEATMPSTVMLTPAMTICSVRVVFAGKYASCAQIDLLNDQQAAKIVYLQRWVRFKNDKVVINMGAFCNSADSDLPYFDPIDGLIRFLVTFRLEHDANTNPSLNYVYFAVNWTSSGSTFLSTNSPAFTKGSNLTSTSAGSVYGYIENSTSAVTVSRFAVVNLVLKISPKPNNSASYKLDSAITSGSAVFCTINVLRRGEYVPCMSPLLHQYGHSNVSRQSDVASLGRLCSTNNYTSSVVDNTASWDDDSLEVEILIWPSSTGPYVLTTRLLDAATSAVLLNKTISWTAGAQINAPGDNMPLFGGLFVQNVPLNDTSSFVHCSVTTEDEFMFATQTSIIRFTIEFNATSSVYNDLAVTIASDLSDDTFDLQRFFVSNIGDNLPCVNPAQAFLQMDSMYAKAGSLLIGDVAYYPIDPANTTANRLTVEAFVRIPLVSSAVGQIATFRVGISINGVEYPLLTQVTSPLSVREASELDSATSSLLSLSFVNTTNFTSVRVTQLVTLYLRVQLADFANLPFKVKISCIDPASNKRFGDIQSARIISMGRNIDGLWTDYSQYGQHQPVFSNISGLFYHDTVEFDLSIMTNTMYGQKMGDHDPLIDDSMLIQLDVFIVDDPISVHGLNMQVKASAEIDGTVDAMTAVHIITLSRTGAETPKITLTTSLLNDTAVPFASNSTPVVQFTACNYYDSNGSNSTAEAVSVTIGLYLPTYIVFGQIIFTTVPLALVVNDSGAFISLSNRIHFGETVSLQFSLVVDPAGHFNDIVNSYGLPIGGNPMAIGYRTTWRKTARLSPVADNGTLFGPPLSILAYTPTTVVWSGPSTPLLADLTNCQFSSSVPGTVAANARTSVGWQTGYRSIGWYQSAATYLTIAFGRVTRIAQIDLKQLPSGGTTPFSHFQLSFGNDAFSFSFLPEVPFMNATPGVTFAYLVPNGFVECQFLRIHLTNMVDASSLISSTSGLVVSEIYGQYTSPPPSDVCAGLSNVSAYSTPRSYLYVNGTTTPLMMFVCDEAVDRSMVTCYRSKDSAPSEWKKLPVSVSALLFWTRDVASGQSSIFYSLTELQFTMAMNQSVTNVTQYEYRVYAPVPIASSLFLSIPPWAFNIAGVGYSIHAKLIWFD